MRALNGRVSVPPNWLDNESVKFCAQNESTLGFYGKDGRVDLNHFRRMTQISSGLLQLY